VRSAIVLVTDSKGLNLAEHAAAVAMLTQQTASYVIFCVGFEPPSINALTRGADALGKTVQYRNLSPVAELSAPYQSKGAHSHVSSAALFKMEALWSIQDEFDRALYIDSDVLLMKDFMLDCLDFEGMPIAGVYDIAKVGEIGSDRDFHTRCLTSNCSPHYFNSGVIAANYERFSSKHVQSYRDALVRHYSICVYHEDCSCDDQCAWNIAFQEDWKRLPLSHNFQACALFNDGWSDATARHYVGPAKFLPVRPWRNDSRDTRLIAQARAILGLPTHGKRSLNIARRMNIIRNASLRRRAQRGLETVERMFKQQISDRQTPMR